ncbi:MAG: ferrous iron transport protein A [Saprospiraceae bacterium]|nr:ferrous iron transport protein A [Saprospiraceae bacterium]MCB9324540.1 ferrous iron transport protein A [Lewinellaceae bacterium]
MAVTINFLSLPLSEFKIGQKGLIAQYNNERIAGKLISMGALPGQKLQLVRKAPFGGALYVKNGKYIIALRKDEASCIIMSNEKND